MIYIIAILIKPSMSPHALLMWVETTPLWIEMFYYRIMVMSILYWFAVHFPSKETSGGKPCQNKASQSITEPLFFPLICHWSIKHHHMVINCLIVFVFCLFFFLMKQTGIKISKKLNMTAHAVLRKEPMTEWCYRQFSPTSNFFLFVNE